ncbi:MAG: UvrD-helicase domain-containing protein [Desulfuromonadaceae bacterium]|nr:UvrD-helicase domain-containing protein [Desulfuromonadaceae bacterium]
MQLNAPQQAAVDHREGALLVLAGAGSGKTRVITSRIAALLKSVPAEQVVALTFTNKAAREMRDRVMEQVGRASAKGLIVSTFHSLGVRILRREIERLGYKGNFSIYGEADQRRLIKDLLPLRRQERGSAQEVEEVLARISSAKNRMQTPETFQPNRHDECDLLTAEVYPRYQQGLKACNAIDFDDILLLTLQLFASHPAVLRQYQQQFRYIMVDEYQDTNHVQYCLLRELSAIHGNLCVVGDDDQSIYGWRGAQAGNILDFEQDFPGARVIKLEQNYRSTGRILAAANALIEHNPGRHEKRLWTAGEQGAEVVYRCCDDGEDEAMAVVAAIHRERYRHQLSYRDFAILYRTNSQSRAFEEQLRYENIPYVLIGGQQFFDRKEVRDVLAYLKVFVNTQDEVNLLRILNYPKRGIGESTAQRLIALSVERQQPLWELMQGGDLAQPLGEKAAQQVEAFIQLMQRYRRACRHGERLTATMEELLKELRLEDELYRQADDPKQARRRVENMHEVVNALSSYCEREAVPTLEGFLEKVSLLDRDEPLRNNKEEKLKQDAVVLMSLHSSKGLEFPCVYLVGFEEGTLPHSKIIDEGGDIAEERRLCYVGMTRARKQLMLLGAARRRRYGRLQPQTASRFLEEIPEPLVRREGQAEATLSSPEEQQQQASDFFARMRSMLKEEKAETS